MVTSGLYVSGSRIQDQKFSLMSLEKFFISCSAGMVFLKSKFKLEVFMWLNYNTYLIYDFIDSLLLYLGDQEGVKHQKLSWAFVADSSEVGYLEPMKSVQLSSPLEVSPPPWSEEFDPSLLEQLQQSSLLQLPSRRSLILLRI